MKNTLIIVNPASGSGKGLKFYNRYLKNLPSKYDFKISLTQKAGHAASLCSELSSDFKRIIICGGDGTFNEAINGIRDLNKTDVGLISTGSGNDFIRNFHKQTHPLIYFDKILSEIYARKLIDIGKLSIVEKGNNSQISRYFINSCGIGFDAYVAYLNQHKKSIPGKLSYIYAIMKGLYGSEPVNFSGQFDDLNKKGTKLLISIGNGKTAGGGLYLTPHAELDDNLLDFTFLGDVSKFQLITSLLPKAMFNSVQNSKNIELGKYSSASFKLKNPYFVHVDGESVSNSAESISVSIIEDKLKFII